MNKYICGVKFQANNLEEAVQHSVSIEGFSEIVYTDKITCINTHVIPSNIVSITLFICITISFLAGMYITKKDLLIK